MSNASVLDSLCKKLGHRLEEVRVRALDSILSKLERGFLKLSDLSTNKDILEKLLEWFGLEPCSRHDQVLNLILKILKDEGLHHLVAQIGADCLLLALNKIRDVLPVDLWHVADEIADLVHHAKDASAGCVDDVSSKSESVYKLSVKGSVPSDGGITDSSLPGTLQHSTGMHDSTDLISPHRNRAPVEAVIAEDVFKHFLLPWQPLMSTDRHVLIAVQESLLNSDDRPQLLHTCNFLVDVMMRDFYAEVFLQRPTIILTFMQLLDQSFKSNDQVLAEVIITCLTTLTIALRSRILFYQDPNMVNFKLEKFFISEGDTVSQVSSSSSSYVNGDDEIDQQAQTRKSDWNNFLWNPSVSSPSSQATSQNSSLPQNEDHTGRFKYTINQAVSESADSDESILLRLQQCSLPQYCLLALQHVLPHVDGIPGVCSLLLQLSHLFAECVTPQLWEAPAIDIVAADIATHFHEVLVTFGEILQQERSETLSRLTHIQLLAVARKLLKQIVPVGIADRCIPRQMKTALCVTVLDGPLHAFFPTLHSDLLQYTQVFKNVHDMDSFNLFHNTLSIADSLSHAAKLLNKADPFDGPKFIRRSECALSSLPFHHNLNFIPLVFDCCSQHLQSWELSENDHQALSTILLKLLAHADIKVRGKAYSHLHHLVLEFLGVQCPSKPPAEALSFLLFDTAVLLEIIVHGVSSSDNMVQQNAEDIILHVLKGKLMMGGQEWTRLVSSLITVLPLLQCWADKPSALGRAITAMFNPDVGSQINLPPLEVLKGNLRFLFSRDESIRGEALSRLVWLLTREENSFNKVPHISDLHNRVTERICVMDRPIDVSQCIPETPFYQESSLLQVLEIAQAEKIEPLILNSALSQLAVMLEDPRLHQSFFSRDGLETILEVLDAAMSVKHLMVHPESVIPSVSVLRSLCFHHTITRHKLSHDINVFFSVLRGLMLYPADTRLRTSASQLLALLSYSDVLISSSPRTTSDGTVVRSLSIPDVVSKCMLLPFLCTTHWRTSHYTEPLLTDTLLQHDSCRVFLATAWNLSFFEGEKSPLLWTLDTPLTQEIMASLGEFSKMLHLSDRDLRVLQATAMLNTTHRQLIDIKAAVTHDDVIKGLNILDSVICLYKLVKARCGDVGSQLSDVMNFEKQYKSLPWRSAFRRFLMAAPASFEDQQLLICVLQFLKTHVQVLQSLGNTGDHKWLLNPLKHPTQPLPNLFQSVAHTGYKRDAEVPQELTHLPKWREFCKELLSLISECAFLERCAPIKGKASEIKDRISYKKSKNKPVKDKLHEENLANELQQHAERWVDEMVPNVTDKEDCNGNKGWIYVIQSVVSCLKSSDSQHFYNLAYLDWLLWALVHLTGAPGWSSGLREAELQVLFSELLIVLLELLQAFHLECGKGGSSCMGLSITRAVVLCVNQVTFEIQQSCHLKEWEALWDASVSKRGDTPWLPLLLQSREPLIRATAMQLAATIAATTKGCELLKKISSSSSDIWAPALCIMLDHEETSLVREQAAYALTNLVENYNLEHDSSDALEALQRRLMESDFISNLWMIIESLSFANICEPHSLIIGPAGVSLQHWTVGSVPMRSVAHLPSDQLVLVLNHSSRGLQDAESRHAICSPAFLKGFCLFLDSVMNRNQDTLLTLAKHHICSHLFRCIGLEPSFNFQNERQVLFYLDSVQMHTSICRILSRCTITDRESCHMLLQQPDSTHKILNLLNPSVFWSETKQMQKSRDLLWTEVLRLISGLLTCIEKESFSDGKKSCYSTFHHVLLQSRGEPFVSVIMQALSSTVFTDLQRVSLACIQSLLSHPACKEGQLFAVFLDDSSMDLNSSISADHQVDLKNSIGADMCHALLALYDIHSLRINSVHQKSASDVCTGWRAQRLAVINALTSLLHVSAAAKVVALNQGFVELLHSQLSAVQCLLTMDPGETMKRLTSRKKVCPILQDIELLIELLNSMATRNKNSKQLAADVGITDVIHKLWSWCVHYPSLLDCTLRCLATLTSDCHSASHSLALTTNVPGLGLRRTPSTQSLLHALIKLFLQQADHGAGQHDLTTLRVACSILLNCCHVPECRVIISKSNILCVSNISSLSAKKSKQLKMKENLWLTILLQFSSYQEGQAVIPKVPDMFDYLLHLAKGHKTNSRIAFQVLRNISFCQMNRPRLLGSAELIHLINRKLSDGETNDQIAAAAIVWALTANYQKGKLVFKCSGTDVQMLDTVRNLAVCRKSGAEYVVQLYNCVLRVIRSEPST